MFTCEKCSLPIEDKSAIEHDYPDYYQNWFEKAAREMGKERGIVPEKKLYHSVHVYYGRCGGTSHMTLCGPLHEETEQERFVRLCLTNFR